MRLNIPYAHESPLRDVAGIRSSIMIRLALVTQSPKDSFIISAERTFIKIYSITEADHTELVDIIEFDEPVFSIASVPFYRSKYYCWLAVGFRSHIKFYGFDESIKDRFLATYVHLSTASGKEYHMVPYTLRYNETYHFIHYFTEEHQLMVHDHIGATYDEMIHINFKKVHEAKGNVNLPLFKLPKRMHNFEISSRLLTYSSNPGEPNDYYLVICEEENGGVGFGSPTLKVRSSEKYIRNSFYEEVTGEIGFTPVSFPMEGRGTVVVLKDGFEYRAFPDGYEVYLKLSEDSNLKDQLKIVTHNSDDYAIVYTFKDFVWDITAAFPVTGDNSAYSTILLTRKGEIYLTHLYFGDSDYGEPFSIEDWKIEKLEGTLPEEIKEVVQCNDFRDKFILTAKSETKKSETFIVNYNCQTKSFSSLKNLSSLEIKNIQCEFEQPELKYWTIDNNTHIVICADEKAYQFKGTDFKNFKKFTLDDLDIEDIEDFSTILDIKTFGNETSILTKEGLLNADEPLIGQKISVGSILDDGTLLYYQEKKINNGSVIIPFEEPLSTLGLINVNSNPYILVGTLTGDLILIEGKERNKIASFSGSIVNQYIKSVGTKSIVIIVTELGEVHVYNEYFQQLATPFFMGLGPITFVDVNTSTILLYNVSNLIHLTFDESTLTLLFKNYLDVGGEHYLVIFDKPSQKLIVKHSKRQALDYEVFDQLDKIKCYDLDK